MFIGILETVPITSISDVNSFHLCKYNLINLLGTCQHEVLDVPLFCRHLLPARLVQRILIFPFVVLAALPVVYWCVDMLVSC